MIEIDETKMPAVRHIVQKLTGASQKDETIIEAGERIVQLVINQLNSDGAVKVGGLSRPFKDPSTQKIVREFFPVAKKDASINPLSTFLRVLSNLQAQRPIVVIRKGIEQRHIIIDRDTIGGFFKPLKVIAI